MGTHNEQPVIRIVLHAHEGHEPVVRAAVDTGFIVVMLAFGIVLLCSWAGWGVAVQRLTLPGVAAGGAAWQAPNSSASTSPLLANSFKRRLPTTCFFGSLSFDIISTSC